MAWTVVIAGGGFGGLNAARRPERRLPRHSARILLVTEANYMLHTPLVPGMARRPSLVAAEAVER